MNSVGAVERDGKHRTAKLGRGYKAGSHGGIVNHGTELLERNFEFPYRASTYYAAWWSCRATCVLHLGN